jgi:hypothetical protein
MALSRQPTWEQGVTKYLEKLEKKLDDGVATINIRIDNLYNKEITDLKVQMARIETQVKIYAAIAGAIGMLVGGVVAKLVVR